MTDQTAFGNITMQQNNKLLLKVITQQEEIKQTLRVHSAYFHVVLKEQNASRGMARKELPEDIGYLSETIRMFTGQMFC